jgi:hypothetical protein
MKQTAVDFIKFELESFGDPTMCELTWEELDSIIERAKKIETSQLEYSYNEGVKDCDSAYKKVIDNVVKID